MAVLIDLQFIMAGVSPLTLESTGGEASQGDRSSSLLLPELSGNFSYLVDGKKRAETIQELYPKLEVCYVKAKVGVPPSCPFLELHSPFFLHLCSFFFSFFLFLFLPFAQAAYAMAVNFLDVNDTQTAEKLLYECLHILDQMDTKHVALPPVVSELGTQAALVFGDVLMVNRKYKYAIEAYESALINLRLRRCFDLNGQALARKIAMVATNNKDGQRALQYYIHILEQAKQEGKINEIVHVSLVAS